jgi:hypothetical protein
MAQQNEEELLREMDELRRTMSGLGTATQETDNGFTKLSKSAIKLGNDFGGAAKQLADGGGKFASMNGVIDLTTKAVGGLLNLIPVVGAGLKELAGAAGDAAKFVLQQTDALVKNYQGLGESSALAADGVDGVRRQFTQLGLVSLPSFIKSVNQNTVGMVAFGGSVANGAEQFSKLAGDITSGSIGQGFLNLGMGIDDVSDQAAKYVSAFSRYGAAQAKTFEELRSGAVAYMLEVDQLARMTGQTRKQQEDEQQKSLADTRFRATLYEMESKGQGAQAKQLAAYVNSLSPAFADAARATIAGVPATEAGVQAQVLLGGQMMKSVDALKNGAQATDEMTKTQMAMQKGADTFAGSLKFNTELAGAMGKDLFDGAALNKRAVEIETQTGVSRQEAAKRAQEELANAGKDSKTGQLTSAQQAMAGSAKNMQELSFSLVDAAIPAVNKFASALNSITGVINKSLGVPSHGAGGTQLNGPGSRGAGSVSGQAGALLDLIGKGESGGNYNALVGGRKGGPKVAGSADLTNMTIAEVQEMQKSMIGQGHASTAVGKYQMIADTLKEQVAKSGLDPTKTKFDQKTQDLLAQQLVDQAGYGKKDTGTVMKNLAGTWASLPKDMSGAGAYDGFNGNKSGINPNDLVAAMQAPTGPRNGYQAQVTPDATQAAPKATAEDAQRQLGLGGGGGSDNHFAGFGAKLDEMVRLQQQTVAVNNKILQRTS